MSNCFECDLQVKVILLLRITDLTLRMKRLRTQKRESDIERFNLSNKVVGSS